MMKEVLLLAHENENDERELMPDENIDTLKRCLSKFKSNCH